MKQKKKEQRSNKWAFLIYQESVPEDYLNLLEELHVPFILSPWHDKDVNRTTGEFKKPHKHGVFFFESLKSYSQVSELISDKLNSPEHVEVVMSPKGMYDYFTHAENNEDLLNQVYEVMRDSGIKEFADFTDLIAKQFPDLLYFAFSKSYFFKIYLDSKRYIEIKQKDDEDNNGK